MFSFSRVGQAIAAAPWRLVVGLVTLVLLFVPGSPVHAAAPGLELDALSFLGLAIAGAIEPLVIAKTRKQLEELAEPSLQKGGQSEAVPWVWYDSVAYVSAATVTQTFYATQQNDRTLSNLLQAGALTDPQYFEIFNLGVDVLADMSTAAGSEVGIIDDIQKLMLVGRPIFTLTISDKNYGPFPLSFLHTSGGATGFGWGTFTAEEQVQYGNNSLPDGGWNWRGSVIIPPKVGFSVTVNWAAAQTINADGAFLRFWMAGALHRRVL